MALCLFACSAPGDPVREGIAHTGDAADTSFSDAPASDGQGHDAAADTALSAHDSGLLDASPLDAGVQDTGPLGPELCTNLVDDNGDGRINELCHPGPHLALGQTWLDLGILPTLPNASTGPRIKVAHKTESRQLLVARDIEPKAALVVADWLAQPDGAVLLGKKPWAEGLARGFGAEAGGTLVIGGADSGGAGTWEAGFRRTKVVAATGLGTAQPGWLHVGVLHRPQTPKQLLLDLDVYVVGEQPMPVELLPSSTAWKATVERVNAIWKAAGMKLGEVSFSAIDGTDGKKLRHVDNIAASDATNELPQLWALAGKLKPTSARVPVFLVASLNHAGHPSAKGITGQIAGVNGLGGHRMGGVAIAMNEHDVKAFMKVDPTGVQAGIEFGRVIAHELGHFLGLWHTSEADASLHDPVADTPECKLPPGHVVLSRQDCPGVEPNLMFPLGTKGILTNDQRAIARRHPWPR